MFADLIGSMQKLETLHEEFNYCSEYIMPFAYAQSEAGRPELLQRCPNRSTRCPEPLHTLPRTVTLAAYTGGDAASGGVRSSRDGTYRRMA